MMKDAEKRRCCLPSERCRRSYSPAKSNGSCIPTRWPSGTNWQMIDKADDLARIERHHQDHAAQGGGVTRDRALATSRDVRRARHRRDDRGRRRFGSHAIHAHMDPRRCRSASDRRAHRTRASDRSIARASSRARIATHSSCAPVALAGTRAAASAKAVTMASTSPPLL
jgi:hypothetical protein